MSDKRETDFLAYILGGLVIAIGGIAVGLSSTNTVANGVRIADQAAASAPAGAGMPAAVAPTEAHTLQTRQRLR
jgi:hypothetical protein